jgi:hypothetical protein
MTNCQVSENWKSGPLMPHTTTTPAAYRKVEARPAASEVLLAKSPKNFEIRDGSFFMTQPLPPTTMLFLGEGSASGTDIHWQQTEACFARELPRARIESDRRVRPSHARSDADLNSRIQLAPDSKRMAKDSIHANPTSQLRISHAKRPPRAIRLRYRVSYSCAIRLAAKRSSNRARTTRLSNRPSSFTALIACS